jgi:DNA replication and repair protein RecF
VDEVDLVDQLDKAFITALQSIMSTSSTMSTWSANATASLWIERLSLTSFRNYASLTLTLGPEPVVLTGPNGAGKTNLLEAVSLLAPGQGLRRAPFAELTRLGSGDEAGMPPGASSPAWAVAARLQTPRGPVEIGTGLAPPVPGQAPTSRIGRIVRIDRETQSGSGALAEWVEMVWLLPAMDGLFSGPAGDRRRFLDRLILCFDPGYRMRLGRFEQAMRQRNKLLETGETRAVLFKGLEVQLAETGVAIAAARAGMAASLRTTILARRDAAPDAPFPWAEIAIEGALEAALGEQPAVDVEEQYLAQLERGRERDRAAGRTLDGPHRSDLLVGHGPKSMPAKVCSTGEQKALLVGLVLAHAELVAQAGGGVGRSGCPPILLLDEIAAHLDEVRRRGLFEAVLRLGCQAWMTGTDRAAFAALEGRARFLGVGDARISSL